MDINSAHSEKQCRLSSNQVHESCHNFWDFTLWAFFFFHYFFNIFWSISFTQARQFWPSPVHFLESLTIAFCMYWYYRNIYRCVHVYLHIYMYLCVYTRSVSIYTQTHTHHIFYVAIIKQFICNNRKNVLCYFLSVQNKLQRMAF